MNYDVLTLIFLHLSLQSLLILRTVCKFWCDVIDSQDFRKLHTQRRSNKGQVPVHLQCYFRYIGEKLKLCINALGTGISLKSHDLPVFDTRDVRVAGAVKGLICVSSSRALQPIAICNPFLGQLKILPGSPSSSCHSSQCIISHYVGVGFDEDYKVVQLVSCHQHPCLQANLFVKRTNSWRELAIDQELVVDSSIMSLFKNGSFAHWKGGFGEKRIILSFDMKNEVFQTITLPDEMVASEYEIHAKNHKVDDPKEIFAVCVLENEIEVKVYESIGEGSELKWTHVSTLASPYWRQFFRPAWWSDDGVLYKNLGYWVCLKTFPPKLELRRNSNRRSCSVAQQRSVIIEYIRTLLSP